MGLPQPGDGNAMGTYTETYAYDAVGNLLSMAHVVELGQLDPAVRLQPSRRRSPPPRPATG